MSKKERPVYAFVRRGDHLVPEMEFDRRALDGVAEGQRVRLELKEFRNVARHRLYWSMLSDVIAATDCALSPERLHDLVKLETGLVELVALPTGMKVALPGSIAFDKISEAEFVEFFNRAVEWLALTYGYELPEEIAA